jgi:hypothetical protein
MVGPWCGGCGWLCGEWGLLVLGVWVRQRGWLEWERGCRAQAARAVIGGALRARRGGLWRRRFVGRTG